MDKRVKWFAAAAVAALAVGPASADHDWNNYHWPIPTTVPTAGVEFNVWTRLTSGYWRNMTDGNGAQHDIVAELIADWDDPSAEPGAGGVVYTDYLRPLDRGATGGDPKKCNPISGDIVICSASYGFRGWLGVATVWINGSHITQATTKLNESYHNSGTYSSYSWRAAVACQEVGHDFGLGHQDENFNTDATESCMEYTSIPAKNETPDWHDFEQLKTIYDAHLAEPPPDTGGDDGGGGPPPGRGKNGLDPLAFREVGGAPAGAADASSRDWGTAIGFDAHGRPNVFGLSLGRGARKITHVTWVPGFRPRSQHFGDSH